MADLTNYFLYASDRLVDLYENFNDFMLEDILRRIVENEKITSTAEYRIWRLQQAGVHMKKIMKYIAKMTGKSEKEVKRIFRKYSLGYMRKTSNFTIKTPKNLFELNVSPRMAKLLAYYIKSTNGTLKNLTKTTAIASQIELLNQLDRAYFGVTTGGQSYSEVVKNAVNALVKTGITVKYPSGHVDTIETAVRRAVVTGLNKCTGDLNLLRAKERGYNHVLVSSHMGARVVNHPPEYLSHDKWQGKVYSVNWEKIAG
jgi:hypothetical protein